MSLGFKIEVADYLLAVHKERKTHAGEITSFSSSIWNFVWLGEKLVQLGAGSVWEVSPKGIEWLKNNGFKSVANIIEGTPVADDKDDVDPDAPAPIKTIDRSNCKSWGTW